MNCRICSSTRLDLVFDLGEQPWGNNFLTKQQLGKEEFYPLQLLYCNECSLSQLSYTVKKEIMFSDHTYLSGSTKSLSNHFKNVCDLLNTRFNKDNKRRSILDIGSNDGTFLQHFKNLDWDILGVESSKKISEIANSKEINTINKFFNLETAKDINSKFDFINASGVFFHLEELHSVAKGIREKLKPEGIFVVQFLYMKQIMKNIAFDQIYHEHLVYYNLNTLSKLLDMHKLEIFDAYLSDIHGGQMIAFISLKGQYDKTDLLKRLIFDEEKSLCNKKESYIEFSEKAKNLKKENLIYLDKCIQNKKIIFGMGAPVKGNTLLNYFGITTKYLQLLLEINLLRKNLYAPGSHIPIFMENDVKNLPDIFYVLAWNFKDEIMEKNKHLISKGVQFYFPIEMIK